MTKEKVRLSSAEVDKRIVTAVQRGNAVEKEEGFSQLFNKFNKYIFYFLNKSVKFDDEVAKDLMMDVFTKIFINIDKYSEKDGALSTWIHRITVNTLIDFKRREKYEVLSIEILGGKKGEDGEGEYTFQIEDITPSNNSIENLIRGERAASLGNALSKIKNVSTRQALILFYFEDKSYKEISDELDIKESQIKAFIHRGKIELKSSLEKNGFLFNF
jgi:RNA polymerase sigma-70 factor (ECF subfamily)